MSDQDKHAAETPSDPAAVAKSRKTNSESLNTPRPSKKPYTPPKLVPWGTLRDITRSVSVHGASDGGSKSHKRGTR